MTVGVATPIEEWGCISLLDKVLPLSGCNQRNLVQAFGRCVHINDNAITSNSSCREEHFDAAIAVMFKCNRDPNNKVC